MNQTVTPRSVLLPPLLAASSEASRGRGLGAGFGGDASFATDEALSAPRAGALPPFAPDAGRLPVVIDGELIERRDERYPQSAYFAQHVAQEVLSEGLYIDPHPAGIAAYHDVLAALAGPDLRAGFDLQA